MAATNDQLLVLAHSVSFRRRIEGFCATWAHTNLGTGTALQKALAAVILANTVGFVTQYAQRFTFSDNVMAAGETVTFNFATECAESSISDANLQSQVTTILAAIAG